MRSLTLVQAQQFVAPLAYSLLSLFPLWSLSFLLQFLVAVLSHCDGLLDSWNLGQNLLFFVLQVAFGYFIPRTEKCPLFISGTKYWTKLTDRKNTFCSWFEFRVGRSCWGWNSSTVYPTEGEQWMLCAQGTFSFLCSLGLPPRKWCFLIRDSSPTSINIILVTSHGHRLTKYKNIFHWCIWRLVS